MIRGPELLYRYADLRREADDRIARELGYPHPDALHRRLAAEGHAHEARRAAIATRTATQVADDLRAELAAELVQPVREHATPRNDDLRELIGVLAEAMRPRRGRAA